MTKLNQPMKGNNMYLEYTTDGMEFHFITFFSSRKKISKIFQGSTKKEVKQKTINWLEKNLPNVPLWKIKLHTYKIN